MSENIVSVLLSLLSTSIGTLGGILVTQKLTDFRLKKLEEKVDKHNNVIERVYRLEQKVEDLSK